MFVSNPFSLLSPVVPPIVMRAYLILMIAAVVVGTLADLRHKRSGVFFARRRRKAREAAGRRLGAGEVAALALGTLGSEMATSGAFCKLNRRISHLLMSWGFAAYVVATVAMVFAYPTTPRPPVWLTVLWDGGAGMVLAGGSWFFFRLKANVAHDGQSPWHLTQADLFLGSLLASVASGLLWQAVPGGGAGWALFGLYLFFTTLLFGSVPWSKFAHMFYKPAAAFQNRVEEASGASDLPRPADSGPDRS